VKNTVKRNINNKKQKMGKKRKKKFDGDKREVRIAVA
jgi:hypothetical protein